MNYWAALRYFRDRYGQTLDDGDLIFVQGRQLAKIPIGTVGQVLTAYPAATTKMAWAAAGGTGGTSDHAALTNLDVLLSGHTSTANRVWGSGASGGASLYSIGSNLQAWDADLDALAALATAGLAARTGPATWAIRTLADAAAGITWTNPAGVAGNPTPVLANDLLGVESLSGVGLAARTASDTWTVRTIAGGTHVLVANGDGASGNPTISLAAEADANWVHPSFGCGQDGAVTYSGGATMTEELQATTVTHNNGVTITALWAIRFTVSYTFGGSTAILDHSGAPGANPTGGAGGATGFQSAYSGAAGANSRTTTASGIAGGSRTTSAVAQLGDGTGTGGAGGSSGLGEAGGNGGSVSEITATSRTSGVLIWDGLWSFNSGLQGGAGGGGGGADVGAGSVTSGAGGGGAGCIVFCGSHADASAGGVIRCRGGAGANAAAGTGGSGGGGGGGQGGAIVGTYRTHNTLPTLDVTGGAGGTGVVSGTSGATGSSGFSGWRRVL